MGQHKYLKLSRHPGLWRVDGIGELKCDERLGENVSIHFSGIKDEYIDRPYSPSALNGKELRYIEHPASLQNFRVGTLWRDGIRVRRESPQHIYELNTSHTRYHKLGSLTESSEGRLAICHLDGSELFNEKVYKSLLHSYFAYLEIPKGKELKWVAIPCSEILRFYYGASSRLLSSILQGSTEENFYERDRSIITHHQAVLYVKKRLSRREAAVIARDLHPGENANTIQRTHNYLSALSARNKISSSPQPITIQSRFPFSGATNLTVAGTKVFMPNSTRVPNEPGLLVSEVFRCDHEFPFNRLTLKSDTPFEHSASRGNEPASAHDSTRFTSYQDEENEILEIESDIEADSRLNRLSEIILTHQLGGIDNIVFEHDRPLGSNHASVSNKPIDIEIEGYTLNDGGHSDNGKGIQGISHFLNNSEVSRDIAIFIMMINHMIEKTSPRGWKIEITNFKDGVDQHPSPLCSFPRQIGKRRRWHLIQDSDLSVRPRHVALAKISTRTTLFYISEMELQADDSKQCTLLIVPKNQEPLTDGEFSTLLKLTAIQRRWISQSHTWETPAHKELAAEVFEKFDLVRINHPKATNSNDKGALSIDPARWSEYLLEKIADTLGLL